MAYRGASIGGAPSFLQDRPEVDPGTMIAALHSVAAMGLRYPLVNLPEVGRDMRFDADMPRFSGGHLQLFFSRGEGGEPQLIADNEIG